MKVICAIISLCVLCAHPTWALEPLSEISEAALQVGAGAGSGSSSTCSQSNSSEGNIDISKDYPAQLAISSALERKFTRSRALELANTPVDEERHAMTALEARELANKRRASKRRNLEKVKKAILTHQQVTDAAKELAAAKRREKADFLPLDELLVDQDDLALELGASVGSACGNCNYCSIISSITPDCGGGSTDCAASAAVERDMASSLRVKPSAGTSSVQVKTQGISLWWKQTCEGAGMLWSGITEGDLTINEDAEGEEMELTICEWIEVAHHTWTDPHVQCVLTVISSLIAQGFARWAIPTANFLMELCLAFCEAFHIVKDIIDSLSPGSIASAIRGDLPHCACRNTDWEIRDIVTRGTTIDDAFILKTSGIDDCMLGAANYIKDTLTSGVIALIDGPLSISKWVDLVENTRAIADPLTHYERADGLSEGAQDTFNRKVAQCNKAARNDFFIGIQSIIWGAVAYCTLTVTSWASGSGFKTDVDGIVPDQLSGSDAFDASEITLIAVIENLIWDYVECIAPLLGDFVKAVMENWMERIWAKIPQAICKNIYCVLAKLIWCVAVEELEALLLDLLATEYNGWGSTV